MDDSIWSIAEARAHALVSARAPAYLFNFAWSMLEHLKGYIVNGGG